MQIGGFDLTAPQMEIQKVGHVQRILLPGPFTIRTPSWQFQAQRGVYTDPGGIHEALGGVRFWDTLRTIESHQLDLVSGRDTFFIFRDSVVYQDSSVTLYTACLIFAKEEARFSPVEMEAPQDHARLVAPHGWLVEGGVYAWGIPLPRLTIQVGEDTIQVQAGVIRVESGRFYADSAAEIVHPSYRAWGTGLTYWTDQEEGILLGQPAVFVYQKGWIEGRIIRFSLKEGRIQKLRVEEEGRLEQENLELTAQTLTAWFGGEDGQLQRVEAGKVEGRWVDTLQKGLEDGGVKSP